MCDDSVLGAPFQIVGYVAGQIVRRRAELEALGDKAVIEACVDALIRVLVDLHTVRHDRCLGGRFRQTQWHH